MRNIRIFRKIFTGNTTLKACQGKWPAQHMPSIRKKLLWASFSRFLPSSVPRCLFCNSLIASSTFPEPVRHPLILVSAQKMPVMLFYIVQYLFHQHVAGKATARSSQWAIFIVLWGQSWARHKSDLGYQDRRGLYPLAQFLLHPSDLISLCLAHG